MEKSSTAVFYSKDTENFITEKLFLPLLGFLHVGYGNTVC